MEDFNSGFTDRFYFNLGKQIILDIYDNTPNTGKLDFKYHDDMTINAFANYNDDTHEDILLMNVGTVVDIFAMMKTAFAQSDILVKLGNCKNEKNYYITGEFNKDNRSIVYRGRVEDDVRSTLAEYASLFALRFIFTHELGHIMNGHTKLLYTLYMNSKIEMRANYAMQPLQYCLDRRTLEMDADAFAATNSIDNVIMQYCAHKNDYIFSLLPEPEDIFLLWGFAISCVFFKFESMENTGYAQYSLYLPNAARFIMVIDSAFQTAKAYVEHNVVNGLYENRDKIIRSVVSGIEQARIYFRKVYRVDYHWLEHSFDSSYRLFSKEVLDNWDHNLYEKLQPYSRAMLYEPNKIDEMIEMVKNGGERNSCGTYQTENQNIQYH